jgi:ATP-dependent Clp protease adaptor protein ClpS
VSHTPEHPQSNNGPIPQPSRVAKTTEGTPPPAPTAPPSPAAAAAKKQVQRHAPTPRNDPRPFETLPQFRVLLHNDEHNEMMFVVRSIVELTPLNAPLARDIMVTAHEEGVAQLLTTHKERAELYQEQFASKGLVVSIEPAL